MKKYICPDCKSNKIEYDEVWNDKTYWCSNCKLDDLYLEDLKIESENIILCDEQKLYDNNYITQGQLNKLTKGD